MKLGEVAALDPETRTITTADGETLHRRRARAGRRRAAELLQHAGRDEHAFPLYSLDDAQRLRSRILAVFEEADRDPALIDEGALNFVVVGGGPTGVESRARWPTWSTRPWPPSTTTCAVTAARSTSSTSGTRARAVLRQGARLRRQGAGAQGRAAPPRRRRSPRSGDGHVRSATGRHPHALRGLGRRHQGPAAGRRFRPADGRGGRIDVARPDRPGRAGRLRDRRLRQHPRARRRRVPAARARWRSRAARGQPKHPRRARRQAADVVPLQGQGHHGHDRPRRRDRGGRRAPARATRAVASRRGWACTRR